MKPLIHLALALVVGGVLFGCPTVTECPAAISNTATEAGTSISETQLEAQRQELCTLLATASPNSLHTNSPHMSGGQSGEFSPYLTQSENAQLLKLLRDPEVAKAMPLELALAALKQREMDGSLPGFQFNALMDVVNQRWPHDPAVIAFYREALATRGDEAISELWSPLPGVWDDSLLEPVVNLIEKMASVSALHHTDTAKLKRVPWTVMDNALYVLDRHYSVWAKDASIPPRLSKAVLLAFPSLTNTSVSGPQPGNQMWCNAVQMLAKSHDLTMNAVLRPFLKVKVVAGDGTMWSDKTPLRACDKAAIAITSLLGDKNLADGGWAYSGAGIRSVQDTYPKWDEWDQKIIQLQKRLDALPKQ